MAQCEKVLDNGERCSNQAIPGIGWCQVHKPRISFRPAAERERISITAPLLPVGQIEKLSASTEKEEPQSWHASPAMVGQKPVFPGLQVDERKRLVAPQGAVWLQEGPEDTVTTQLQRVIRLLGLLSQAFPLPEQVKVFSHGERRNYLLLLAPVQSGTELPLSIFYDTASDATHLVDGALYIGEGNTFVHYRDDNAPQGYDVPGFSRSDRDGDLLLVANEGTQRLSWSELAEVSLKDLCLRIVPLPGLAADPVPEQLYALVPSPLYLPLAKYFQVHHLFYRLARLQAPTGELILFEIRSRPDAPPGRAVPAFILDYLSRLPRVVLLTRTPLTEDRMIFLQWKHRYPLHIPHVAGIFEPDEILLLVADHYPTLLIKPVPQFFDGDRLVDVHLPRTEVAHAEPLSADAPAALKLEVMLRPDPGPTPPIAALILISQEMTWLRRLLYLLDREAFRDYLLYQGEDLSVLVGQNRPIEGLPFGMPLRRPGNRVLFIPLRSHFVPDISWSLLQETLALQEATYTFLTSTYRLDLPENLFVPLSRVLVAEPNRPRVQVRMLPPSVLPTLTWAVPVEPPVEAPPDQDNTDKDKKGNKNKKGQSTIGGFLSDFQPGAKEPVTAAPRDSELDEKVLWREKARICEEAKDFLAAAVCYTFLKDISNSARCYRLAADALKAQGHKGG